MGKNYKWLARKKKNKFKGGRFMNVSIDRRENSRNEVKSMGWAGLRLPDKKDWRKKKRHDKTKI